MEQASQLGSWLKPIKRMKNQLPPSLLKGSDIYLDKFCGKREISGSQIQQRGHV
jgi:hypothetical protein